MRTTTYKPISSIFRRLRTLAVAISLGLMPLTLSAEEYFGALASMPQVESTFISGRFAHNSKTWYSRDHTRAFNLSNGFSALYSYGMTTSESVTKAEKLLNKYLKDYPNAELVQSSKCDQEEYKIYELFQNGKIMEMIIWNKTAPNVAELVVVQWRHGLEPTTPSYPLDK